MTNYIAPGKVLTFVAPVGGVVSGSVYKIQDLVIVATVDAAEGAEFEGYVGPGVFEVTKADAQAWAVGQKVYWDNGNSWFTTTAGGNTLVGTAAKAVAITAGLTTGWVRLDGVAR